VLDIDSRARFVISGRLALEGGTALAVRSPVSAPPRSSLPGGWDLGGDLEGLVEAGAFDQAVPANLLLCLGERAVADHHVTVAYLHGGGGPGGTEAFAAANHATPDHLFGEGGVLGDELGPAEGASSKSGSLV
jgi:hypothetical protein